MTVATRCRICVGFYVEFVGLLSAVHRAYPIYDGNFSAFVVDGEARPCQPLTRLVVCRRHERLVGCLLDYEIWEQRLTWIRGVFRSRL